MKAVRIDAFGGPDQLKLQNCPVPHLGEDEVLLKVAAASVNPVDYKIREGTYPAVKSDKLPYIMGRDVSGTIEACGSKARGAFKQGESVYAMVGIERGCYAEHVVVKPSEAAAMPTSIGFVTAAAVPLAGLTAWQGLFRYGKLTARQRVLIHGGAGGVGHLAVQFAKAKGAFVIATASANHADFLRDLGADDVIDYKKQRFDDIVRDVDLVFDLIAGDTQQRSFRCIRRGGRLISTLTEPSQEMAHQHGVEAKRYTVEESAADLKEIAHLIDAGQVKPKVSKTFPLDAAADAQTYVAAGHTEGKIVLRIAA